METCLLVFHHGPFHLPCLLPLPLYIISPRHYYGPPTKFDPQVAGREDIVTHFSGCARVGANHWQPDQRTVIQNENYEKKNVFKIMGPLLCTPFGLRGVASRDLKSKRRLRISGYIKPLLRKGLSIRTYICKRTLMDEHTVHFQECAKQAKGWGSTRPERTETEDARQRQWCVGKIGWELFPATSARSESV